MKQPKKTIRKTIVQLVTQDSLNSYQLAEKLDITPAQCACHLYKLHKQGKVIRLNDAPPYEYYSPNDDELLRYAYNFVFDSSRVEIKYFTSLDQAKWRMIRKKLKIKLFD